MFPVLQDQPAGYFQLSYGDEVHNASCFIENVCIYILVLQHKSSNITCVLISTTGTRQTRRGR